MRNALSRALPMGLMLSGFSPLKAEDADLVAEFRALEDKRAVSEWIAENAAYSDAVHRALPHLGEKLPDGLWTEWVLPGRILDEDVSPWRKTFHDLMQPVVAGKASTKQAVDAIIEWLWLPDEKGQTRVRFGKSENRTKTPLQILALREGTCGELNLVFVCLLRSVGIPARLCQAGWWYGRDDRHFYSEYWDSQRAEWVPWDSSDNLALRSAEPRSRQSSGVWSSLAMYAYPSVAAERDLFNTEAWDKCIPVTDHIAEVTQHTVVANAGFHRATASVWNHKTWRSIAFAGPQKGATTASFQLCESPRVIRPLLWTATDGASLYWALGRPRPGGQVVLQKMEIGKCIKWSAYDDDP